MIFAENNRVSHRQLYRQIVLTFTAPFLLCLFGEGKVTGVSGIVGVILTAILLSLYVIFLIRQAPCYGNLKKTAGAFIGRAAGIFFLVYVIFTAAYVLYLLGDIVPKTLVTDMSGRWIALFAVVACGLGTHKGMQRRGRVADTLGGIFLVGIVVIFLLCIGQADRNYLREMFISSRLEAREILRSGYGILCAFSGFGLFPFLLEYVEKSGSAWKPAILGIFTVAGIVVGMLILLPSVFGWNRLFTEEYPVLPLLAGADLPGNVLARFDVLWMGFLLFSLLFALGSLLHYGHLIIHKTHLGSGRYWLMVVVFFLAVFHWNGMGIEDYYGKYLAYIYIPGLLLLQVVLMLMGKEKRKRKTTAAAAICLLMTFLFAGCGGVEPEKRRYPFAMGVDVTGKNFSVTYGMPDLPEATGQGKPEENGSTNVLNLEGESFAEIEELYNRSQEKYLDMGHLEVLVLGKALLEGETCQELVNYLKEEPFIGENMYVFWTENPKELLEWKNDQGTSLGEYVTGIMENRQSGQQYQGVTLRQVYYQMAKDGKLPELPQIYMEDEELQIFWTE